MDRHIAYEKVDTANSTVELFYLLTDERGSIVALVDSTGAVIERYAYSVYGDEITIMNADWTEKTTGPISPVLWSGAYFDNESGLYWMRNRYYHPDMKRFINQDPIGIWGDANNLGNGFAYVAGMVVEHRDPTGLDQDGVAQGLFALDVYLEMGYSEDTAFYWHDIVRDNASGAMSSNNSGSAFEQIVNLFLTLGTLVISSDQLVTYEGEGIGNNKQVVDVQEEQCLGETPTYALPSGKQVAKYSKLIFIDGTSTERTTFIDGSYDEVDRLENGEPVVRRECDADGNVIHYYVWDPDKNGEGDGGWVKVYQPSDPYEENDTMQSYFANQMLKKMLMMDKENPLDKEQYVEVEGVDGRKVFTSNPFYRGKDPMKEIYWRNKNADGTWGFSRNPFAPPSETEGKYKNTYESRVNSDMGDMTGGFIDPPPE